MVQIESIVEFKNRNKDFSKLIWIGRSAQALLDYKTFDDKLIVLNGTESIFQNL